MPDLTHEKKLTLNIAESTIARETQSGPPLEGVISFYFLLVLLRRRRLCIGSGFSGVVF
jgi:hypothetical protein